MTTEQLLVEYPLTTQTVREWFLKKMMESFSDEEVPEDFKAMMLAEGIPDGKLFKLIDAQPRSLFDVFDDNGIFIQIFGNNKNGWSFEFLGNLENSEYATRKAAEVAAIESAFSILEEKLQNARIDIIGQNGNTGEHYEPLDL